MAILGIGTTPPEDNVPKHTKKTVRDEASIFNEMFKDGIVTANEQFQYAYDVISENEDLMSKIKNCGKDLSELIKKYSWPIKHDLKNIKGNEKFNITAIKGSVSIVQNAIENEIINIDRKEYQKPEQGQGFWFESDKAIDHLIYVKNNLKTLGISLTDDEISDVIADIMATTDFDFYNSETSMLKKQKFCNKDTDGNYIETHFLDYVVNACKREMNNKPCDNK